MACPLVVVISSYTATAAAAVPPSSRLTCSTSLTCSTGLFDLFLTHSSVSIIDSVEDSIAVSINVTDTLTAIGTGVMEAQLQPNVQQCIGMTSNKTIDTFSNRNTRSTLGSTCS